MPDESPATPQAADPTPAPKATPPPGAKDEKAASGAAAKPEEAKPLSAKEHAAIEKAKYDAREARRALKDSEARRESETKAEREARVKLEGVVADLQKQIEAMAKGNPLKGRADAEAVIREFVEGETPERRTAAEIAEANRKAEAAERKATELEQKIAKRDDDERAQRVQHAKRGAVDGFAQAVTSGDEAKKYAYLNAMHSKTEIRAMAAEIQDWAESEGKTFTYEQVALHLDKRAKSLYDERKETLRGLLTAESGGSAAAGLAPPAVTGRAGSSSAGNGHRASGPETGAKPTRVDAQRRKTREQEEEEDLAMLRKASAADAAAKQREAKAAKH